MRLSYIILIFISLNLVYADDQILEVITKLNSENTDLEINVDELLNPNSSMPNQQAPVTVKDSPASDLTAPKISLPDINTTNSDTSPSISVPTINIPSSLPVTEPATNETPKAIIEPVITKELPPSNIISSPKSPGSSSTVINIAPKAESENSTPETRADQIQPSIQIPKAISPTLAPKPNENIDDIIIPTSPQQDLPVSNTIAAPKAVPTKTTQTDKPSNTPPIFEGLLPKENNKNSKTPDNKNQTSEYQVVIKPEQLWEGSFMFTKDEQDEMLIALSNFISGMTKIKSDSDTPTKVVKKNKVSYTITLRSIMYINSENWTIWINNSRISSKDKSKSNNEFKILKVEPKKISIELVLNDDMDLPDMLTLHQGHGLFTAPVEYRIGDKKVKFDISPNQIFNSKTMTINDL